MARNPDEAQVGATVRHQRDDGLSPFRAIAASVSAEGGDLVKRVSALIDQAQSFAVAQVNATLTLRNWYMGRMIDVAVLHEERAGHDQELVASLGRQVSWTHFKTLLPVSSPEARAFYVKETIGRLEIAGSQTPDKSVVPLDAFHNPVLLETHKEGTVVAEYWTALPPKAELEAKVREIYREAQERVARRQIAATEYGTEQ